jgi:hypothetical protein
MSAIYCQRNLSWAGPGYSLAINMSDESVPRKTLLDESQFFNGYQIINLIACYRYAIPGILLIFAMLSQTTILRVDRYSKYRSWLCQLSSVFRGLQSLVENSLQLWQTQLVTIGTTTGKTDPNKPTIEQR